LGGQSQLNMDILDQMKQSNDDGASAGGGDEEGDDDEQLSISSREAVQRLQALDDDFDPAPIVASDEADMVRAQRLLKFDASAPVTQAGDTAVSTMGNIKASSSADRRSSGQNNPQAIPAAMAVENDDDDDDADEKITRARPSTTNTTLPPTIDTKPAPSVNVVLSSAATAPDGTASNYASTNHAGLQPVTNLTTGSNVDASNPADHHHHHHHHQIIILSRQQDQRRSCAISSFAGPIQTR
jgi:hypothetical protein